MKKKMILMGAAALLIAGAFAGGSLAYFQADGREVRQQINTPELGITLVDGNGSPAPKTFLFSNMMPGGSVSFVRDKQGKGKENELNVKNDGDVTLYTRITITKAWGDEGAEGFEKDYETDPTLIELTPGDDWYVMSQSEESAENLYLYYKHPLEAGKTTPSVLKSLHIPPELKNEFTGRMIQMKVEADAVQYSSAEDAILTEWGVYPVFDADGNIVEIEE